MKYIQTFYGIKLDEENPRRKFYKKRIRKWDAIIGHRFFSHSLGFFTVKKVWNCVEYSRCAEFAISSGYSHWLRHYTVQIKTDNGEVIIMHKLPLDLEHAFDKCFDKKNGENKSENR